MTVAEVVRDSRMKTGPEWEHFVFENVPWDFYEQTLQQLGRAGQHARVTYDQGRMEIMTTSGWHEGTKKAVARLLELYSLVRDVPIQGLGNLTFQREDLLKGLEPDECYYITNRAVLAPDSGRLDLLHGPPPDLVVEVEVTRSDLPKRPIYAAMGVPELWAISSERLTVLKLEGGTYVQTESSQYFPDLNIVEFFRFVRMARDDQHAGVKAFDAWLHGSGAAK